MKTIHCSQGYSQPNAMQIKNAKKLQTWLDRDTKEMKVIRSYYTKQNTLGLWELYSRFKRNTKELL